MYKRAVVFVYIAMGVSLSVQAAEQALLYQELQDISVQLNRTMPVQALGAQEQQDLQDGIAEIQKWIGLLQPLNAEGTFNEQLCTFESLLHRMKKIEREGVPLMLNHPDKSELLKGYIQQLYAIAAAFKRLGIQDSRPAVMARGWEVVHAMSVSDWQALLNPHRHPQVTAAVDTLKTHPHYGLERYLVYRFKVVVARLSELKNVVDEPVATFLELKLEHMEGMPVWRICSQTGGKIENALGILDVLAYADPDVVPLLDVVLQDMDTMYANARATCQELWKREHLDIEYQLVRRCFEDLKILIVSGPGALCEIASGNKHDHIECLEFMELILQDPVLKDLVQQAIAELQ